ncbi:phosphoserine phosphatase SerB [Methylocystis heyeri]|uniref:Phosphoserine phosphatase n=1 Tax=Methylocystis heyeri TaxID=391905 RepID=A0A6B8KH01_9HYPH|nr:phosphoserine phosphatase SerB [Methylocystis heyeri]QGM47654.1 phosphoserine phosphatase SerB [Methylocystis heyeri]
MSKSAGSQAAHFVATFVAAPGAALEEPLAVGAVEAAGVRLLDASWLERGVALDIFIETPSHAALKAMEAALCGAPVDIIAQPAATRRKSLLVADMDATMIAEECLDELACVIGKQEAVSALTAQAMRGEIDFEQALVTRVAMFEGVTVEAIEELIGRLSPSPGAKTLVATMSAAGGHTALVSGGFTLFAEAVARRLGFDEFFANSLEIEHGRLTGRITPPIRGKQAKGEILTRLRDARGLAPTTTLAVGDGANDLDMLARAGLGAAWRAKPQVAAMAKARIDHADLTALLYAQGFRREEFVEN